MKKKLKVLIVEDEYITARHLSDELLKMGCNTLTLVASGEEAIDIALKDIPDLILMDINLSGIIDGFEAAKMIAEKKDIPVIFMTGYRVDSIEGKTSDVRILGFLTKPILINDVKELIDRL